MFCVLTRAYKYYNHLLYPSRTRFTIVLKVFCCKLFGVKRFENVSDAVTRRTALKAFAALLLEMFCFVLHVTSTAYT